MVVNYMSRLKKVGDLKRKEQVLRRRKQKNQKRILHLKIEVNLKELKRFEKN